MQIPASVLSVVGDVLGTWHHSHAKIDALFQGCGFPGSPPPGNCVAKCQAWLRDANSGRYGDPLDLLGRVLVDYMHLDSDDPAWLRGRERVVDVLAKNGLAFELNGVVCTDAALAPAGSRRCGVALSFPGEHRAFVGQVADQLAHELGQSRVLYDKYNEAEFARPDLDLHLPSLYLK